MSSFEVTTRGALLASSSLRALVGDRIYRDRAPRAALDPYIFFRRRMTTPTLCTNNGQNGSHELDRIVLEVSCFCRDPEKCDAAILAVRRALEAYRPTVYVLSGQESDISELPELYGVTAEFDCSHPGVVST